ncbi:type II toxin-antitoxin system VapC family toxin [Pedobacter miscanthi]|uniref:Type II toxin-antitoxin system VapC family toxin n=1 Tax=Pedobacter miscanthi TaxID=2259170 RepID=A0A366KRB4_9SPHI|nr:type II toxin-antitoxin system VapC family toxin [Pedobacter miscanthi]RBQ03833.1 type II toxin-antitoxin system VapC family toxin [Pedobacter miscanthi]
MIYLLDTHVLIWSLMYSSKLSDVSLEILKNKKNTILVSTISFWEISLKHSMNKLDILRIFPDALPGLAIEAGYELLPLLPDDVANYHQLNATWHRDPFDRMLIWQAIQKNITLISKDEDINKYQSAGLKVVW